MKKPASIGNDIVDIEVSSAREKIKDERFIRRVFSPEEQTFIFESGDPAVRLWSVWSAKETAFKIVAKSKPDTVFSHRNFLVTANWRATKIDQVPYHPLTGHVDFGKDRFRVLWHVGKDYVHCLGSQIGDLVQHNQSDTKIWFSVADIRELGSPLLCNVPCDSDCGLELLSQRELESVHSEGSHKVRLLAKRLLAAIFHYSPSSLVGEGCDEREMKSPPPHLPHRGGGKKETQRQAAENHLFEVVRMPHGNGFGPPEVFSGSQKMKDIDVSLSHDGRFVAAAVAKSG